MKHWNMCVCAFIALLCMGVPVQAKTYKFFVPISEGLSMGSISSLLQELAKTSEKKTGVKIEVVDYTYSKGEDVSGKTVAKFKKGEIDFAYMFSQDFIKYAMTGDKTIVPSFSITMYGKPYAEMCVYTRKSDNISSIKSLKGKTWGGANTIATRYLMYKSGIDTPLKDFFSKMVFVDNANTAATMDALLDHKIDAAVMASFQVGMVTNNNKKYNAVDAVQCREYEHNWIFVHHKDIPRDLAAKFKKTFLGAHKDKDFAQFKFIMQAIQGHFVDLDVKELKTTIEIVNLATNNGWYKEEKQYIESIK